MLYGDLHSQSMLIISQRAQLLDLSIWCEAEKANRHYCSRVIEMAG